MNSTPRKSQSMAGNQTHRTAKMAPPPGPGPGDALELIAEQHVLGGGHKVHPVHVHLGRSDPLGISLNHLPVDEAGIPAVAAHRHCQSSQDDKDGVHLTLLLCY